MDRNKWVFLPGGGLDWVISAMRFCSRRHPYHTAREHRGRTWVARAYRTGSFVRGRVCRLVRANSAQRAQGLGKSEFRSDNCLCALVGVSAPLWLGRCRFKYTGAMETLFTRDNHALCFWFGTLVERNVGEHATLSVEAA